jgi:kynurenine 3-monooxygenase
VKVTVIGAGLGGALMGVFLGRAGHDVTIYERRPDPRKGPAGRSRSINLAISTRGIDALARLGLDRKVLSVAVPMRGRMLHEPDGSLRFQPYGHEAHHVIHSVSRAGLNRLLVEEAEATPRVSVVFDRRCVDVEVPTATCVLEDTGTGARERVEADLVVGADGAYSEVRLALMKTDRFEYAQSYLPHGYKELTILPKDDGGFRMEPNALHIWPRESFMMIALPNVDGRYTCTCFWPFEGPRAFSALRNPTEVRTYFERVFPDAATLISELEDDFLKNPVGSLVTVKCAPWRCADKVVLLGDAAHAIVPFYGQGANASFEDCVLLDESLKAHTDLAVALRAYDEGRKRHTDALADLAIENFVEMRDRTASTAFLLGKKLEKTLAKVFPGRFVPLYYMVTFSRTPYADAVRRARAQWRAVAWTAAAVALAAAGGLAAFFLTR